MIDALEPWLRARIETISQKGKLAETIRYALSRWEGLSRFLEDGRIEIDSNTVERAIRPLVLNRKNALFAGSDVGGELWAVPASLVESCKINSVEPHAYIADVLSRLVNAHSLAEQQDQRAALTVADGVQFGVQPVLGASDTSGNIALSTLPIYGISAVFC